uniref:Uncharacterized protein n=1 Tax=Romanomermis culicivorax TaxID=13658 RepID=A0A915ICE9_ROMCU
MGESSSSNQDESRRIESLSTEDKICEESRHIPTLSERYESLDYEIIENKIYKNEEMSSTHQASKSIL